HDSLLQLGAALAGAAVGTLAGDTQGAATGASTAFVGVTNNYLKHQEVDQLLQDLRKCGNDNECKDALLKDAIALSNSRNPYELLDPSLNRDAAFAELMLQWAASDMDYGMISLRRLGDLAAINADHLGMADNTPVLTSGISQDDINRQTMLNNWHYGQSTSLSEGWLTLGAGGVTGTGLRWVGYAALPAIQKVGAAGQVAVHAARTEAQLLQFGYRQYVVPSALAAWTSPAAIWVSNPANVQNLTDFTLGVFNLDPNAPTTNAGRVGATLNMLYQGGRWMAKE
ncbi:VENN motif pre-toxin domain-containing protein, partial [Pseudothauera rhizosphaerae]